MNIDTNTLIFIALAIMMILIVICFICNSINSSKINTLMDYSDEGDTYVREIVGGQTPIKLLDEENAALENAKSKLKRTENNG